MNNDKQIRGHCPHCAREQAVVNGKMAKHGYRVTDGYFLGVCTGDAHPPIEVAREPAAQMVHLMKQAEASHLDRQQKMVAGEILPSYLLRNRRENECRPYADGKPWEQEQARRSMEYAEGRRAKAAQELGQWIAEAIEMWNGKPLKEVARGEGPAPIRIGDRKLFGKGEVKARSVQGPRVYYVNERGFRGWIGTQAWRKLDCPAS